MKSTHKLSLAFVVFALASCGGGDSGSGTPPVVVPPLPPPPPPPPPPPTPPTSATVSYLHVFQVRPSDGGQPNGPLVLASDGNFYGTTRAGGTNRCRNVDNFCGVVFRVTPTGDESVIYDFGASSTDGFTPSGPLVQGRDGALYGVTSNGGTFSGGTIFRVTLGGGYSVLHSFGGSPTAGIVPLGGLVEASNGSFYGTTASGGANQCGNIPQAGNNCGTVFRITPAGAVTYLHSFGASRSDGVTPNGSLLLARDGDLYGTTVNGGANSCSGTGETNNCGTVFKVTPSGVQTVIYSFGNTALDGIAPQGALIQGADGALYGTTVSGGGGRCGGNFGCGTVFRMTTAGSISILHAFSLDARTDGYGPSPYLLLARDGNFYGTTGSGGTVAGGGDLNGTVFRVTPSGTKTTLFSFGPLNENPSNPVGGVIEGTDGSLYGTLAYNGRFGSVGAFGGSGAVFRLVK